MAAGEYDLDPLYIRELCNVVISASKKGYPEMAIEAARRIKTELKRAAANAAAEGTDEQSVRPQQE